MRGAPKSTALRAKVADYNPAVASTPLSRPAAQPQLLTNLHPISTRCLVNMDLPDNTLAGSSSKSAPAPKRRKTNGASSTSNGNSDDGTGNNNKPKRQPSCDLCRARKVRCVKADGQTRCDGCIGLNQQCAYTHERKKPGPANRQVNMVLPDRVLTLGTVLLRNLPPAD